MFKRLLAFIIIGIFTTGCSALGWGECKTWVDAAFVNREFNEQTGELHLVLDLDEEELSGAHRPVALFLIPQEYEQANFRYGQYWEKIDPQSEIGARALAAATEQLAAQEPPSSGSCRMLEDHTLSGCTVVIVSMSGLVGSCCKYPLAYSASIFLSIPAASESDVLTAVAILDDSQTGAKQCSQVVIP